MCFVNKPTGNDDRYIEKAYHATVEVRLRRNADGVKSCNRMKLCKIKYQRVTEEKSVKITILFKITQYGVKLREKNSRNITFCRFIISPIEQIFSANGKVLSSQR